MLSRRELLSAMSVPFLTTGSIAQTPFKISGINVSPSRPIPFGGLWWDGYPDNELYTRSILKYTNELVDGNKMSLEILKKDATSPFDFTLLDRLVGFAARNNIRMRGSHMVWGGSEGKWIKNITSMIELERIMETHIRAIMTRYPGRFYNYIVVNEPLSDDMITPLDLRHSAYQKVMGENHIAMAFKYAAAADPKAELMLNEYGIEFNTPKAKMRREGLRRVILNLLNRGIKIDAIGLQSHLMAHEAIDRDGLQKFVEEMKNAKLKIHITELDVFDHNIEGDFATRDRHVGRVAYTYLDTITQVVRPASITPWGMSDKHAWGNRWFKRKDGTRLRSNPLDDNYVEKPLLHVINHFCKGAPLSL